MIARESFDKLIAGNEYEVLHTLEGAVHIQITEEEEGWYNIKRFKEEENGNEKRNFTKTNGEEGCFSASAGNCTVTSNVPICIATGVTGNMDRRVRWYNICRQRFFEVLRWFKIPVMIY